MSKEGSEGLKGTIGGRGTKIKSKRDLRKHPSPKGTEAVPGGQLGPSPSERSPCGLLC